MCLALSSGHLSPQATVMRTSAPGLLDAFLISISPSATHSQVTSSLAFSATDTAVHTVMNGQERNRALLPTVHVILPQDCVLWRFSLDWLFDGLIFRVPGFEMRSHYGTMTGFEFVSPELLLVPASQVL